MIINNFSYDDFHFINYTLLSEVHIKKIFDVRNLASIRSTMTNSDPISWEEHLSFIESLKRSSEKVYFAVIRKHTFICSISLHPIVKREQWAEWGIYVNPEFEGEGLAKKLSTIFFDHLRKNSLLRKIKALVKFDNSHSLLFHKKLGFIETGRDTTYAHLELSLKKTFIIAELSANHNGSKKLAIETVLAAKQAGADAVKLQTYTADTITIDCRNDYFKIKQGTIWDGKFLFDLYKEAYTPWEWHAELFEIARDEGLIIFSTPFDNSAVDFLESINNPIYKIASFEITDINLIRYAASKGKPMILSTGIATEEDIKLAVETCRKVGNDDITLLKCTSCYPAPVEKANLATIPDMASRFGVKVGISDHTTTNSVAIAAVSLGASVVEKHLIVDRKAGGPDSKFSMEPYEFRLMTDSIREVERAIGTISYPTDTSTIPGREFSRSLFIVKNIKKGELLTEKNIRSIRPAYGIHPKYLKDILGKKVICDIEAGTPMDFHFIDNKETN
jgi:pseudaminic acid synthase